MPPVPLTNFSPGQRVTVHTMPAQPDLSLRLRELGMVEGSNYEITLKKENMTALRIGNAVYALNKNITNQIMVEQYKALSATVI